MRDIPSAILTDLRLVNWLLENSMVHLERERLDESREGLALAATTYSRLAQEIDGVGIDSDKAFLLLHLQQTKQTMNRLEHRLRLLS